MIRPLLLALLVAGPALASPGPQPVPPPPPLPVAVDVPWPHAGIRLAVDARDVTRRIVRVRETIGVGPGPLVLLYPEWVAGAHSPINTVDHLSGLVVSAGGRRIEWRRDPVVTSAFHVVVPPGVDSLELAFEWLTPTDAKQGRVTIADDVAHLQWQGLLLYPAGVFVRDIPVEASVTLPDGWQLASGLDVRATSGETTEFAATDLETLADSPVMAGRFVRRIVLDPGARPVRLNLFAESADALAATPAQVASLTAMLGAADALFGARPFDHYDFLVALSDTIGTIGREHRRSTEIVLPLDAFTAADRAASRRTVFPHEYAHAWNGKAHRGADSWTADFNTPIGNSLLWLYEGQTTYWTSVLAARSGMIGAAEARDVIAQTAAVEADASGRGWRSLADTVNDPPVQMRRPQPWASRQRKEDYYGEGALVWLDADTLIRERSGGKRSLDDFAREFFAGGDGPIRTYVLGDVVAALNRVLPYDWAGFLSARLEGHERAPLDGLARGGYALGFAATPSDWQRKADAYAKRTDLSWSIGFTVDSKDATLSAVQWDGPAYKAGLTAGTQLIAVDGAPYTPELLTAAIAAAAGKGQAIELIVKSGGRLGTVAVDWHGGLRYPRLERLPGTPARLDDILSPRR